MAIKFEKIKAGDTLYDLHSYRMGNTTMRTLGCWDVKIIEVYPDRRAALVSWNGNRNEIWYERRLRKLRAKEPVLETNCCGQQSIKRKE